MDLLRRHVLSKYLTSKILYVFTFLIHTNDIRRMIFDLWSIEWCKDEHHIANQVFDAMDYIMVKCKYQVFTCSICERTHYLIYTHTSATTFPVDCFPQLDLRDFNNYREWLIICYNKLKNWCKNRFIEQNEMVDVYKSKCERKSQMPQDNFFERFLIPFYNKKTFYKRIKEHEEHLNERLFKRRKLF